MNKVKIFISYKDRHPLIQSNILTPIQTGRAISPEIFNDMIGDDTGENISEKNNMYNELSAQYWAWKNYQIIGNPDYIGFMHYRRHFIFNEKKYEPNFLGVVPFKCINNEYIREIGLDDDNIYNFIKNYDIVCIKRLDLKYRANILNNKKCCNPRECYAYNRHLYKKDYDKMIEVLNKLNPEYTYAAKQYTEGSISFGYNSFVMKKDIFFEYNNFLFPILFELEKNIDFTNYCNQGIRTIGYLGERLLSIFIIYKLNSDKCKIKETPMSFIENSKELQSNPEPVFGKECIVMTSSNFFAPYTYVAIMSMIEKYDTQKN